MFESGLCTRQPAHMEDEDDEADDAPRLLVVPGRPGLAPLVAVEGAAGAQGTGVWGAARLLADCIATQAVHIPQGSFVLELGAGCGKCINIFVSIDVTPPVI